MKKLHILVTLFICFISMTFVSNNSFALVINSTSGVFAQSMNFSFNFSNPGARAAGMGGAFIGVADDATAAFTNPAGLTILTRPEIAAEFRQTTSYTPTNNIIPPTLIMSTVDSAETYRNLSFVSYSHPLEKANLTLYRHQMVASRYSVDLPSGSSNQNVTAKLDIVTYALAGAYKLSERLSVGISLGFSDFDYYNILTSSSGGVFVGSNTSIGSSSKAPHATVALLWSPFDQFNVGLVYRYGPNFTFSNSTTGGTANTLQDTFKTPDVYGAGISYRFLSGLTLAADINYIKYSQISDDFVFSDGSHAIAFGTITRMTSDYKFNNAYEFHAGLEQAFSLREVPLAFRVGYAFKEGHSLYADPNGTWPAANASLFTQALPKGSDEHIGSVGLGVVLGKNFQIDAAASYGRFTTELIGSFVYRF